MEMGDKKMWILPWGYRGWCKIVTESFDSSDIELGAIHESGFEKNCWVNIDSMLLAPFSNIW